MWAGSGSWRIGLTIEAVELECDLEDGPRGSEV